MSSEHPYPGYAVSVTFKGGSWQELLSDASAWLNRQRPRVYEVKAITCHKEPYYDGEENVLTVYYE